MSRFHARGAAGHSGSGLRLRDLSPQSWLGHYIDVYGPSVKIDAAVKYGNLNGWSAAELHRAAATMNLETVYGEPGVESTRYWRRQR